MFGREEILKRFNSLLQKCGPLVWKQADELQNKLLEYLEYNDFSKTLELVRSVVQEYKVENGSSIVSFFETIAAEPFSVEKSNLEDIPDSYIDALTFRFIDGAPAKQIIIVDKKTDFEDLKRVSEIIIGRKLKEEHRLVFPFLIAPNTTLQGRVIQKLNTKAPYNLMTIKLRESDNQFWTYYIDSQKDAGYGAQRYIDYFHTYDFITDANKNDAMEYKLISKIPIESMEDIIVTGMTIPICDKIKVGSVASINKGVEVIFVTDVKKVITKIDDTRFEEIIKKYNHDFDLLYTTYFGEFRHPRIFEQFLLAWLFSTDKSYGSLAGYKPNLGILGPTRGGKSRILDCLARVFKEGKISENTTLKAIVPNFGGTKPDAGEYLKKKRFLLAEEFLTKLNRSEGAIFDVLKSLLVHDTVSASSGKFDGQRIDAKPTATMAFASNFQKPKINNIVDLANHIDPSILSRFIIYVQGTEHYNFITERKRIALENKQRKDDSFLPKVESTAIELFDYLTSKKIQFGNGNESDIFEYGKEYLPDDSAIREVYNGAIEHIIKLIDGVTKKNYILEGRTGKFIATEQDFLEAKNIWIFLINSWTGEIVKLPPHQKIQFLTKKQNIIYKSILAKPGISKSELDYILEETSLTTIISLINLGLIKKTDALNISAYYPITDDGLIKELIDNEKPKNNV